MLTDRQPVEIRTVQRREHLEAIERAFFLEHLGVKLEGAGRGENAGAAAGGLLGRDRMRRAVGAEKELRAAGGSGAAQRQPVLFALGDRQAIKMRANAAL